MKLDKSMIGKFITRIGPCDYGNGNFDSSYIGEKLKLLHIDKNFIIYANENYKEKLDKRWNDDNWELYVDYDMIDINKLSTNELYLIKDALKALLIQDMEKENKKFNRLNEITKLGKRIEKQLDALPF